ncbi:hypothetical protein HYDPIDRAFT_105710 [Hydnomerulius pinastri MD-312]|nr:hypothetical protein HYDPIDRAFT_105710 [Hydnomerulius pinastri MD-312]
MAARATANAASLGVDHHTLEIPWGVTPFPSRPTDGAFEKLAREARYQLIFDAMTRTGATTVAFGHHVDDQVETSLMRLARGSTDTGAAGMRRCRRWGMGFGDSEGALGWAGHRGLNRFIIRPLLGFGKDRILATCEANGLDYIDDPTNFQPALTLRNAVRKMIGADDSGELIHIGESSLPEKFLEQLQQIKRVSSSLQSTVMETAGVKERLRRAVRNLAVRVEEVDKEVTSRLEDCTLPSPAGTLLLSSSKLLEVVDPDVRFAMILRVMRHVSFHPWGSIRADGDRRRSGIDRIVNALWTPDPQASQLKKFTAGGGVLWTVAISNSNKRLRVGCQCLRRRLEPDDQLAWLASRIPPFFKNPQQGMGSSSPLTVDLTACLEAAANSELPTDPIEVLYDRRFLLRFDPNLMPSQVRFALRKHDKTLHVKILPFTEYFWPQVVLQRGSDADQVLALLNEKGIADTIGSSPWISMEWVRSLDAT